MLEFFKDEDGNFNPIKVIWIWAISSVPLFLIFAFVASYLVTNNDTLFMWSTGITLILNAVISIAFLIEEL